MAAKWKKIITSGSAAVLASITLDTGIENAALANSSVSYGGVALSLGGTDATPAFDLADATGYLTTALSGTITNAQLAGSIANAKLTNSSVSYGGVALSLGGTDATPAFDLADATGYLTTALSGTITNAQLAGSIANAKLTNSTVTIGATSVALGATTTAFTGLTGLDFTAAPASVGASIGANNLTLGGGSSTVVVAGNLTVNGTTTTISTTNSYVEDKFLIVASGSQSDTDGGIIVQGAAGSGYGLGYDSAMDRWAFDADLGHAATDLTPDAYVGVVETGTGAGDSQGNPLYGGATNGVGSIYIKTDDNEIWIFA